MSENFYNKSEISYALGKNPFENWERLEWFTPRKEMEEYKLESRVRIVILRDDDLFWIKKGGSKYLIAE